MPEVTSDLKSASAALLIKYVEQLKETHNIKYSQATITNNNHDIMRLKAVWVREKFKIV